MKVLYFDCFSGISGDMTVGALRDLGVAEEVFLQALGALNLGGEFHADFQRDARRGISGWKFDVHAHQRYDEPGRKPSLLLRSAADDHVHGRSFVEICRLLRESKLSEFVKTRATAVFRRIAVAEGKIHGFPPDEVSFHEVGAVDSIADIVAACAGLEALGVDAIQASALVEGTGWVDCAHGRFPLPAPATLEILAGIPLRQIDAPHELITPTGAALLAEFATTYGPMPELKVEKIGYGLGTRDTAPRPNVLRAVLGEVGSASDAESDEVVQIETNLDDLTAELTGAAIERLWAAGALDVFCTPVQMKKNRPGILLTVLSIEDKASDLARLMLTETTAFGVRMHRVRRLKLRREFRDVETPHGLVRIKLGFLGVKLVQASPEYEVCRRLAEASGASVRDIHAAALAALPREN